MTRRKLANRPVAWKIHIDGAIAAEVELRLSDPLTGKIAHGARAMLFNKLLALWLEEQRTI